MCAALAAAAEAAGAPHWRGVEASTCRPVRAAFPSAARRRCDAWRPRLVIGADGRNSRCGFQLALKVLADPPHT